MDPPLPNCQKSVKHAGTSICAFIDLVEFQSFFAKKCDFAILKTPYMSFNVTKLSILRRIQMGKSLSITV